MNAYGEPTWGEYYAEIDKLGRQVTEAKLDLRVALMMLALAAGVLDFSKRDEKGNLIVPTVEELEAIVRDLRVRLLVADAEIKRLRAASAPAPTEVLAVVRELGEAMVAYGDAANAYEALPTLERERVMGDAHHALDVATEAMQRAAAEHVGAAS